MAGIVILISGRGSNMVALLENLPPDAVVHAVISNRADAAGLEIARARGIAAEALAHDGFASREDFDAALRARIDHYQPDWVVLAGFMRILSAAFVAHYRGRLLNIHPSLLPAFQGLHTHRRALAAGVRIHGATVHFVTAELDGGPPLVQGAVAVQEDDDEDSLAARVLAVEHRIYPQALAACLSGAVWLDESGRVRWRRSGKGADGVFISPQESSS